MTDPAPLQDKRCVPCEGGVAPLSNAEARALLSQVAEWSLEEGLLVRTFTFKNFHETMAFVNAVAWVAHCEDHHPDMEVGYKTCRIVYVTHAIGGLSENDFICAAKINALTA